MQPLTHASSLRIPVAVSQPLAFCEGRHRPQVLCWAPASSPTRVTDGTHSQVCQTAGLTPGAAVAAAVPGGPLEPLARPGPPLPAWRPRGPAGAAQRLLWAGRREGRAGGGTAVAARAPGRSRLSEETDPRPHGGKAPGRGRPSRSPCSPAPA